MISSHSQKNISSNTVTPLMNETITPSKSRKWISVKITKITIPNIPFQNENYLIQLEFQNKVYRFNLSENPGNSIKFDISNMINQPNISIKVIIILQNSNKKLIKLCKGNLLLNFEKFFKHKNEKILEYLNFYIKTKKLIRNNIEFCDKINDQLNGQLFIEVTLIDKGAKIKRINSGQILNNTGNKTLELTMLNNYNNKGIEENLHISTLKKKFVEEKYNNFVEYITNKNNNLKEIGKDVYLKYINLFKKYKIIKKEISKYENKTNLKNDLLNNNPNLSGKICDSINSITNLIKINNSNSNKKNSDLDTVKELLIDIKKISEENKVNFLRGLSQNEKKELFEVMGWELFDFTSAKYIIKDPNLQTADLSGDSATSNEEGDLIINLIEKSVNRYYRQGVISKIKIEQIEVNKYCFNGQEVGLYLDPDDGSRLVTENGEYFNKWIINNFKKHND